MNRRGFLGALVGLPAAAAVTAPVARIAYTVTVGGLAAWIPRSPPAEAFFGIDRSVHVGSLPWHHNPDLERALLDAAEKIAGFRPPRLEWREIDWREVAAEN